MKYYYLTFSPKGLSSSNISQKFSFNFVQNTYLTSFLQFVIMYLQNKEVSLMEWIEKMEIAMYLIKQACSEQEAWKNCKKCPFNEYCDYILAGQHDVWATPDTWEIN